MANWIAAEVEKFKQWVKSHCESTNAKLDALEQRVTALEVAHNASVGLQTAPPLDAPK